MGRKINFKSSQDATYFFLKMRQGLLANDFFTYRGPVRIDRHARIALDAIVRHCC